MSRVYVRGSSYDYPRLRPDVFAILDRIEADNRTKGLPVIKRGASVLVKPNLLAPSPPEEAIVTHPLVVKAAVEYALERGGRVRVGDSPPMGKFERTVRLTGLGDALAGLDAEIVELKESRRVEMPGGGRWRTIELSGLALDSDIIINIPKLKTHCQMGLTLAVKNTFGCVVGLRKPEWHFRIGENRYIFAELIVTVHTALRPSINLIDGVLAMEGDGPGSSGTPRNLGVLLGSADAPSLDAAVCRMIGLAPEALPTLERARAMGLPVEAEIDGELPEVRNFKIPGSADVMMGPPRWRGFFRRHVASRPVEMRNRCKLCGECMRFCPAKAISMPGGKLEFDYDRCIRCYCCLEVCPHRAMKRRDTLLNRALRAVAGN